MTDPTPTTTDRLAEVLAVQIAQRIENDRDGSYSNEVYLGALQGIQSQQAELKTVLDREAETQRRHDAKLDKLEAEIERLREAMRPFAKAAEITLCGGDDYWTDDKAIQGTDIAFHVKFGDLRRASAALSPQPGKESGK